MAPAQFTGTALCIYNAFYQDPGGKRKVIFIENCATTNEKVLCGRKNFRSPTQHLSLPRIELGKNETEKIKYLRFIVKKYNGKKFPDLCGLKAFHLRRINIFTINIKSCTNKKLSSVIEFPVDENSGIRLCVMYVPFSLNATALVNHIKLS